MAFTFFFRDMHALELIQQHVVPRLRGRRYVDIWDAGCANGAEPYTLAILLRENMGQFAFRNVRIVATDINGAFAGTISEAAYPVEQVKRIPADLLERYFEPADTPGDFRLVQQVREAVRFEQHDLTSLRPVRRDLGLILCKNVLLHLSPAQRVDVLRMFYESLSPEGFLATEPTQKMPPEAQRWFEPVRATGTVYRRMAGSRVLAGTGPAVRELCLAQ